MDRTSFNIFVSRLDALEKRMKDLEKEMNKLKEQKITKKKK